MTLQHVHTGKVLDFILFQTLFISEKSQNFNRGTVSAPLARMRSHEASTLATPADSSTCQDDFVRLWR